MENDFSFNKSTDNSTFGANFAPKNYVKVFENAHQAVMTGARRCNKITLQDSIFQDCTAHSKIFNLCVSEEFKKIMDADQGWHFKTHCFKSNRMTYCLIDRKFFICFKALGKKSKIEGMDTARFADTLNGDDFAINKQVRAELTRLNIVGTPPIIFVGFNRNGNIVTDILFQNYYRGETVLNFRLNDLQSIKSTSKLKAKSKSSNEDNDVAI